MPTTYADSDKVLQFNDLTYLLMAVGANASEAQFLVSVTPFESGQHTGVLVNDDDDLSYGLWQINMKGSMGAQRMREWGLSSYNDLYDPVTNAVAALKILRAGGTKQWGGAKNITRQASERAAESWRYAQANPTGMDPWKAAMTASATAAAGAPGADAGGGGGGAYYPSTTPTPSTGETGDDGDVGDYPGVGVDAAGNAVPISATTGVVPGRLPSSPEEIEEYVREHYSYMASFLNNPDVGPILMQAATQGWSPSKLYGAIVATPWWQTTSASEREWQQLMGEDPKTAEGRVIATKATISNLANRLGVTLAPDILENLATDYNRWGWGTDELIDSVMRYSTGMEQTGDISSYRTQIKNDAARYFVKLSDEEIAHEAQRIASGEMTVEGLTGLWANRAKGRFAAMPEVMTALDAGLDPETIFAENRQAIAETLELGVGEVSFMDPSFEGYLNPVTDTATSKTRAPSLTDTRLAARNDKRYVTTDGSRRQSFEAAQGILQYMGLMG